MKYLKGQSGNLKGRPKGAQNRITRDLQEILKENAPDILQRALEKSKSNPQVLNKLLDKIVPTLSENDIKGTGVIKLTIIPEIMGDYDVSKFSHK